MDDCQRFLTIAIITLSAAMTGCGSTKVAAEGVHISPEVQARVLLYTDLREHTPSGAGMFIDDSKEVMDAVAMAFKPLGSEVAPMKYMHFNSHPFDTRSNKAGTILEIEKIVPEGTDHLRCYVAATYGNVGGVYYEYILVRERDRWVIQNKPRIAVS